MLDGDDENANAAIELLNNKFHKSRFSKHHCIVATLEYNSLKLNATLMISAVK